MSWKTEGVRQERLESLPAAAALPAPRGSLQGFHHRAQQPGPRWRPPAAPIAAPGSPHGALHRGYSTFSNLLVSLGCAHLALT